MNERFQNAVTAVVALCALAVTGLVLRREVFASSAGPQAEVRTVQGWQALARAGNPMGPAQPRVRVVEFSDFQCPFCAQAAMDLKQLRRKYPGQVAVIYRHFPLPAHRYAQTAAVASECAAEQGRFEAYHDLLFASQDSIGVTAWDTYADRAGVTDLPRFRGCLAGSSAAARVDRDRDIATRLGTRGTPTFVVNGKMFSGSNPPGGWDAVILEAMRAK